MCCEYKMHYTKMENRGQMAKSKSFASITLPKKVQRVPSLSVRFKLEVVCRKPEVS